MTQTARMHTKDSSIIGRCWIWRDCDYGVWWRFYYPSCFFQPIVNCIHQWVTDNIYCRETYLMWIFACQYTLLVICRRNLCVCVLLLVSLYRLPKPVVPMAECCTLCWHANKNIPINQPWTLLFQTRMPLDALALWAICQVPYFVYFDNECWMNLIITSTINTSNVHMLLIIAAHSNLPILWWRTVEQQSIDRCWQH